MPIYVYETVLPDGTGADRFEVEQSMHDEALSVHPVTGQPIRRVYLPPRLATKYTPGSTAKKLDNKNVEKAGFVKYERDKLTGSYHKVAGRDPHAPAIIKPT